MSESTEQTLRTADGRQVGFAQHGDPAGVPVVWCHGGPGSRLEAQAAGRALENAGLRVIGIDRPGYGLSTPLPGRTIASWVDDALAVVDSLGLDGFFVVGISTGGAYALALAALAPHRVRGVAIGCGMSDMSDPEARRGVVAPGVPQLWEIDERAVGIELAQQILGADGSRLPETMPDLAAADVAVLTSDEFQTSAQTRHEATFAQGVIGYVDDRRADGPGWNSFDVTRITAPVIVVHGAADTIVSLASPQHTAAIVPGAVLRIIPDAGHFSVGGPTLAALAELVSR